MVTMRIMQQAQARPLTAEMLDKEVMPAVSALVKWLLLDLVLMARNVLTK